jgi:hypothetical protein
MERRRRSLERRRGGEDGRGLPGALRGGRLLKSSGGRPLPRGQRQRGPRRRRGRSRCSSGGRQGEGPPPRRQPGKGGGRSWAGRRPRRLPSAFFPLRCERCSRLSLAGLSQRPRFPVDCSSRAPSLGGQRYESRLAPGRQGSFSEERGGEPGGGGSGRRASPLPSGALIALPRDSTAHAEDGPPGWRPAALYRALQARLARPERLMLSGGWCRACARRGGPCPCPCGPSWPCPCRSWRPSEQCRRPCRFAP